MLQRIIIQKDKEIAELRKQLLSFTNSQTATRGYNEERMLCRDLNTNAALREKVSKFIGVNYDNCIQFKGYTKCDIRSFDNTIKAQVKKYKSGQFQQIDRHWISDIPCLEPVAGPLKSLCEYPLLSNGTHVDKSHGVKRLLVEEYTQEELDEIISTLNNQKDDVLKFALLGTDSEQQPTYLFAIEYINNMRSKIVLFNMQDILQYLSTLNFKIMKKGTVIALGDEHVLSLQRKGGDGGKKSSNQLQMKIIVSKLLDKVVNMEFILAQ